MVRVYKLAQELGMTNNEIIDELKNQGIMVKNHMSSVPDEEVEGVKSSIVEARAKRITEKRVKPTVIRRRVKKIIQPEVASTEADLHEVEAPVVETQKREIFTIEKPSSPFLVVPKEVKTKKTDTEKKKEVEPEKEVIKPVSIRPARKAQQEPEVQQELEAKKEPEVKHKELKQPEAKKEQEPEKEKAKKKDEALPSGKPPKRKVVYKKKEEDWKRHLYEEKDVYSATSRARARKKAQVKKVKKTEITLPKAIKRKIKILETITVGELAKKMGVKVGEVIKKLLDIGVVATINQPLELDTASLIAGEFSYSVESVPIQEDILERTEDPIEELVHRPPVVTVMGHVDHGKTSLLDAIRETNVIDKESGGITQHIGAYHVKLLKGEIVFLDTPGHEAFTAMRARGAHVTDIVILVIAADDGVMGQTVEAINHAKAACVTLMVAINKIDKANADIEKVKRDLMEYELIPEELGGETIFVEVSAKKKQGIDDLLELVLLQAEVLELKANPNKSARGIVIEAKLDKGRGPVATVLIQEGTLKTGNPFVAGMNFGKIRALINEKGEKVDQVKPSMPIEVIGLAGVPEAGDSFIVVEDEKKARQVAMFRQQKKREIELAKASKITLEELYAKIQEGDVKELNVIIKADVQGSVEALINALLELSTDTIKVIVIHSSVGAINESDVMLASASNAIIIGFNVKSDPKVQQMAEQEKVSIRFYSIIYDMISDVKKAMEGLLEPQFEEKTLGRAQVRDIFKVSKIGTIAGSFVHDGKIIKGENARLLRDNVVIYEGKISSLKRFKDDVREVQSGYECGIGMENFNDVKLDDIIESYTYEKILPRL
ncbi:MAG: translation initiation factor IF-2 [Thermodesulfobacteriota bacterium]|nr:translation initiation factor IF-2 [Thermodesulfobacteriota bacterium]